VDGLVRAFAGIPGDAALVIAGRFQDPAYEQQIRELAARDARVQIHARYLPDDELQVFLNACDVVVAPYREILTSGSAILAASFGRPIVSLDKGFLRDVVTPATGLLFPPDEPNALEWALQEVRDRRFDPATIVAHVAHFRFSDAAERYATALGLLRR
jgi:beta-1,4-mannosyltransferase